MCSSDLASAAHSPTDLFAPSGWLNADALESDGYKALQRAASWAADTRWETIRTPHIFMGLLSIGDRRIKAWCRMIGADPDSLLLQFAKLFSRPKSNPPPFGRFHREFVSENAMRSLRTAVARAGRCGRTRIAVADLLVAIFAPRHGIVPVCFADVGLEPEHLAAIAVAADERDSGKS